MEQRHEILTEPRRRRVASVDADPGRAPTRARKPRSPRPGKTRARSREADDRASRDLSSRPTTGRCAAGSTKHEIEAAQPRAATPARGRPPTPTHTIDGGGDACSPDLAANEPARQAKFLRRSDASSTSSRHRRSTSASRTTGRVRTRIARLEQPAAIVETLGPASSSRARKQQAGIAPLRDSTSTKLRSASSLGSAHARTTVISVRIPRAERVSPCSSNGCALKSRAQP